MAVSKSRRFEVFKRDGFTCQYCGRRPGDDPSIILELDHIEPRALGGGDDELNLITACWECNRGKRAVPLGEVHPRPDADIAYLEVQQEIAEARRYAQSLAVREAATIEVIEALSRLWVNLGDEGGMDWHPSAWLMRRFLTRYSPEIVEAAFRDVVPKVVDGQVRSDTWDRYLWAVMRNLAEVS